MDHVDQNIAVFGSVDKYLGPAAVESVKRVGASVVVRILEPGEFGAFLQKPPRLLRVDGKTLSSSAYKYSEHLVRIPKESFGKSPGDHDIEIVLPK